MWWWPNVSESVLKQVETVVLNCYWFYVGSRKLLKRMRAFNVFCVATFMCTITVLIEVRFWYLQFVAFHFLWSSQYCMLAVQVQKCHGEYSYVRTFILALLQINNCLYNFFIFSRKNSSFLLLFVQQYPSTTGT